MKCRRSFIVVLLIGAMLACGTILIAASSTKATTVRLRPPFTGTYRQTAYMDHVQPFATDGFVLIYNGERTADNSPYPYDGHEGNDWGMMTGTLVLAAAKGSVTQAGWQNPNDHSQGYGLRVRIDHQNGYETLYGHLSNLITNPGAQVAEGDTIANSGGHSTGAHLHLSVYHNGNLTDPFGWRGNGRDPLYNYDGETSICLWRSLDEDPISCADTIVEDAGQGSTVIGAWNVSVKGNGYHAYYRANTTDNGVQATWISTRTVSGIYKVYAFIPEQPPGVQTPRTQQAKYSIWSDTGWQTRTINQSIYTNTWVLLGTFRIPTANAQVVLSANTGEAAGTRLVMADAIKFRSYLDYLPLILKQPTPTPTSTPTPSPTPTPTRTPTPPPVAQCGQNALLNAGFESGLPGAPWQQYSSGGRQLISANRPRSGSWGAWLGGYDSALDKLYQGYTIPPGATQSTLEFWWYMTSDEPTTEPYDYLEWTVQSPPGNDLATRGQVTNTWPRGTWSKATSVYPSLGPWIGLPMWIDFEAKTDGSTATHFFIDDVSLVIQCGGASGAGTGGTLTSPLATPTPHR